MKRQAGGTSPATDPAAGTTETGGGAAGAGPTGYTSVDDPGAGGAELLEDRTLRISGGGHGRRFGLSVPGAVISSLAIAALAFGAAIGPLAGDEPGDGAGNGGWTYVEPTKGPEGGVAPAKTARPDQPKPPAGTTTVGPPKDDTLAEPKATEAPPPDVKPIEIGVGVAGATVVVEWSACEVDGFVAYKVIRSKDQDATWPLGAGDSLAAAIVDAATTRFVDTGIDAGRTYTYRIVALLTWNGETVVGCSSAHAGIKTPAPAPKPVPTEGVAEIAIAVELKEDRPFISWTACSGVDFDYYKVVRSTDATVTWPKGDGDSLVTALGRDGETKTWDGAAPSGTTVYYRVFCVRSTETGYVVKAASAVKGIVTPVAAPLPAPVVLSFGVDVTGEGAVLTWGAWAGDGFRYYKVVRSTTTDNPSYFPWTDGTELIGVIENSGTTQLVDSSVTSGQTIYYRVQAIGSWNGSKILLGQTAVVAVTIP